MKFTITGDIAGTSGYAAHTRNLFNSLSKIADVKLNTNIPQGFENQLTDKELESIKKQDDSERIGLIITSPVHWKLHLNHKKNLVYLIWEGDKIPQFYLEECLNPEIDKIICPSEHTKRALWNTYFDGDIKYNSALRGEDKKFFNKVFIIPHGVNLDDFYPKKIEKDKFIFLFNKGFRNLEDRGGLQYLIKAYLEEFSPEEKVELYIKINPAYGVPDLIKFFPELNNPKKPHVVANISPLDKKNLNNMYNYGDVFVSPTRSESFNIPCAESSACNKMNLVTGYGGQTDFIKDGENGLYIDYDLEEVKHELQYEGIKWATPKIEDLRKKLRWCYENQDKVKQMGIKAGEKIKKFTWDNTAKKINELGGN